LIDFERRWGKDISWGHWMNLYKKDDMILLMERILIIIIIINQSQQLHHFLFLNYFHSFSEALAVILFKYIYYIFRFSPLHTIL